MLLKESEVRRIIRNVLISEGYEFDPPYSPGDIVRIKGEDVIIIAVWSAGRAKQYMVVSPKNTAIKGPGVEIPKNSDMKFWKSDKSVEWHIPKGANTWRTRHKRLGQLRKQKRLVIITGASTASNWAQLSHFEPKSEFDIYVEAARDTFIEITAVSLGVAAAAATALGAAPIAAALEGLGNVANVADVMNKITQKNWLGAAFAILGLVPGGDTLTLLNKLGAVDDVIPPALAKEIAGVFVDLIDGDLKDTVTELVNAYASKEGPKADNVMPKLQGALTELKDFFMDVAEESPKIATA